MSSPMKRHSEGDHTTEKAKVVVSSSESDEEDARIVTFKPLETPASETKVKIPESIARRRSQQMAVLKEKIADEQATGQAGAMEQDVPPASGSRQAADANVGASGSGSRAAPSSSAGQASSSGAGPSRSVQVGEVVRRMETANIESKQGTQGRPVQLTANYFEMLTRPNFDVVQYRVDFDPDIESSLVRKRLLHEHIDRTNAFIFDGSSLFMVQRLPNDFAEFQSVDASGNAVNITIRYASEVSMQDDRGIQILNLALRKSLECLRLQQVARHFFDPAAKVVVSEEMQLWPGYVTSIRQHERAILLCAEITHKVMRMETIYDILRQCLQVTQDYKESFHKLVLGTTVLTDYNNRTYRIDDIDYDHSPSTTFNTKEGDISYVQYYKRRYNITIRDERQPLLITRPKAKDIRGGRPDQIFLIPELCRATGLTEKNRQNFSLMQDIAKYTKMDVPTRMDRLMKFRERLNDAEGILNTFNMELAHDLVRINGRELNQEKILFGENYSMQNTSRVNWTTDLMRAKFFTQVDMENWTVIYPSKFEQTVNNFLQCLRSLAQSFSYGFKKPDMIPIPNDSKDQYLRGIDKLEKTDIVMFVLPNNDSERYKAIKKRCCVDRSILSQVVTIKNITPRAGQENKLKSVGAKVLVQMNAKMGGIPWNFNCPLQGLMTVGFDVTHDASHKEKSYGAMIATMDMKVAPKFYSTVNAHSSGEEISSHFGMNMAKALHAFQEEHGSLPERIMIYRDGVGDGQLKYVQTMEVEEIKKELEKIYAKNAAGSPKWAYVIVNKRLNTRFFNRRANPIPGTVIDDIVTLPDRHDFFLISQSVNQGTVSPTSYTILHNTIGLSVDKIQMLTYKWTHCYYNWSGTTRVPGVCMLAKKLAGLVGQYLHQPPQPGLEKTLYYL